MVNSPFLFGKDYNVEYKGWFKIWRKLFKNPVFKNNDPYLFKVFMYCLYRANHEENKILINGNEIFLRPGEFITGRNEASKDLYLKSKMWDRKLVVLEKLGILTRYVTKRFSKISIINWNIYQGSNKDNDQDNDPVMTKSRPSDDQVMTTDKNVKNDKNVKKKNILSDEDFLKSLKEKFTWINFDEIMVKMDAWLLAHPNRKKTRRFIVGWLNKIDKPLEIKNIKSKESPITKSPEWIKEAVERGWK